MDNRCGQKDRNVEQLICENALKFVGDSTTSPFVTDLLVEHAMHLVVDHRQSRWIAKPINASFLMHFTKKSKMQKKRNQNRKLWNQLGEISEQFQAYFCPEHHQFSTFLFNKAMDLSSPLQAQVKMLLFQLTNLDLPGMFEESC
ncbi:hypothetical protein EGR_10308 [Echinococcus granulosus]|uniref:Uncharacterized protein n=1 Tax=Echinococcus granulosus TaxID=6210 RepID=W6U1B4_ECHGR|nr:hypothetical protein EGR_10308 [Echinococcus granulosus]EUB54823.1 hypothetical protein EGR_10308 [Echinococcus granulosus]